MNLEPELAPDLERAVPHLPSAPATAYLAAGRRARRRRRAIAGVAGVAVLALTGGVALSALDDPAPPSVIGPQGAPTDDDIPGWAQEHGNHGPVSIHPNGELWVAPDARVIKSVEIPAGTFDEHVMSAYVTESEFEGDVWWSFVYRTSPAVSDRPAGEMEPADEWTTDFDLWRDYITAKMQGRTRFSDRLVRFADSTTERLVARPGAQILDQIDDVDLSPGFQNHPRTSVAEVSYGGKTWFVIGSGPRSGSPWYTPYQAEVTSASDIDGFLDYLNDRVSDSE